MRILFVCLGNICRSPIAEGVLRHYIQIHHLDWTVASAGIESYHVGAAPHHFSQKVCKVNGVDISAQKARKFKALDFDSFDKIYAMSKDVYDIILDEIGPRGNAAKLDLFLHELKPGTNESVPDPWYGDEDGYLPVYKMIDETCRAIIEKYQ